MKRNAVSIPDFPMKVPILLLALLAFFVLGCQSAEPTASENVDEAYRRLAERAAAFSGFGKAELRAGVAADEVAPHIPKDAVVLGTVTREGAFGIDTRVFLELPQEPEEAVTAITDALAAAGWDIKTRSTPLFGDMVRPGGTVYVSQLCRKQVLAFINAERSEGASHTEVEISLQQESETATCGPETLRKLWLEHPFPALESLAGTQTTGILRINPQQMYLLSTRRSAQDVDAYYATQLQAAGWRLVEQGDKDTSTWSLWTFTDSEGRAWAGAMSVALPPEPIAGTQFRLVMLLEAVPLGHSQLSLDSRATPTN